MTEEKKSDLAAAARISDISLRWTMTQLFFLIHSGLFSVVLIQFRLGSAEHLISSFFGLWLAILWLFATVRANRQIDFWNRCLAELELREEPAVRIFATITGGVLSLSGVPIYGLLIGLVSPFLILWVGLFSFSLYRFIG